MRRRRGRRRARGCTRGRRRSRAWRRRTSAPGTGRSRPARARTGTRAGPTCSTASAAAVATTSACGSALPTSSEASIDHPPDDEPRVLAALEHHRQVVQRGVGVRAARRLDPGRDRVVVAVGLAVVEQRPPLERVLGVRERHRPPGPADSHASSSALSAVRASPPERSARNSSASGSTVPASPHSPRSTRAVEQHPHLLGGQRRRARTPARGRAAPS